VRGIGRTLEEAFEQAALALTAIVLEPEAVEATSAIEVSCEAPDDELLLVDWLNALIYEMATRRYLFGRFAVKIEGGRLTATAWGQPIGLAHQELALEPKGATYTALSIRQHDDDGWTAECVVDV
jgi:tRNA nucleotidyltransferase (CCA-adding enzyme)